MYGLAVYDSVWLIHLYSHLLAIHLLIGYARLRRSLTFQDYLESITLQLESGSNISPLGFCLSRVVWCVGSRSAFSAVAQRVDALRQVHSHHLESICHGLWNTLNIYKWLVSTLQIFGLQKKIVEGKPSLTFQIKGAKTKLLNITDVDWVQQSYGRHSRLCWLCMRHVSKDVPCRTSLSAQAAVIGRLPSSKLQWQSVSGLPQWMSISASVSGSSYMAELHSQENLQGKIMWNNSTQSNLRFDVIMNRQCWVSCELGGVPVMRGSVTVLGPLLSILSNLNEVYISFQLFIVNQNSTSLRMKTL